MERLWAPWRMEFILQPPGEGCIFCLDSDPGSDADRLVLHRSEHSLVMMNRYPYVNGHLLAAPFRHTPEPDDLSPEEFHDLGASVLLARRVLREAFSPDGFNIGMNLGRCAGAGIADHCHVHIVPRWSGDTSFMAVIDDVRVISESLVDTYGKLLPRFRGSRNGEGA